MITRRSNGGINNSIEAVSKMKIWEHVWYIQMRELPRQLVEFFAQLIEVILSIIVIIFLPIILPLAAHRRIRDCKRYMEKHGEGKN